MSIFTRTPVKQVAVAPPEQFDEEFAVEYSRVASRIGVQVQGVPKGTVLKALSEEGIGIYPIGKVERWMDKKGYWSWFPLRSRDREGRGNFNAMPVRETPCDHPSLYGGISDTVYHAPVPFPVLLTVERLIERFGEDARFFVAAPEKHPDPFLALLACSEPSPKLYVIERWDEPGFRG